MMLVSFLVRQRRALALCTAVVLLHVLALWWVLPQLGKAGASVMAQNNAPIVARLLSAAAPAEPAPRARVEPVSLTKPDRPSALAARKPQAAAQASAVAPSGEPAASEQGSASVSEDALVPPVDANAPLVSAAEPAAPVPAEPVTMPPARRYKVNLPPSSHIMLDVERRDADGTLWHGEAAMAWTLQGERYTMNVSAGIRLLLAHVNLVLLESEGTIGESGFAPTTMTEKRRGRSLTATHFNARDGQITFSASTASFALLPGAQDKASLPLQLAAIARGDSTQLDGGIEILVGGDQDASVYRFEALGQEQLDTGLGKVAALHLSRPPQAGVYGARLDIWLAPEYGWYPVQVRNIEANGAVTTQTVKQIVMTKAGV